MAELLRNGKIVSADGEVLMRILPTSLAPVIPYGARVTAITNSLLCTSSSAEQVTTPLELARRNEQDPVPDTLQGGIKHIAAFYVISCTDDVDLDGVDYPTERVCCGVYPMTSHVICARLCEAHAYVRQTASQTHSN
uniref:Uncharacterized protein n=1 Tax=Lygus hesperus TaxID=30085 RepID=A0A0A9W8V3_LYGHE